MKRKVLKRMLAVVLSAMMLVSMAGCSKNKNNSPEESNTGAKVTSEANNNEATPTTDSDGKTTWDKLDKITLYPNDGNTPSGVVTGYKADIFAKRGLELEVWPFSDEKTNAILASGDLPDVMFVNYEKLQSMIEGGLVLNLDEYMDKLPHITGYDVVQTALNYTREYKSAGTGDVYGIPIIIGEQKEGTDTGRNAVKVNWKAYVAAGYPEIKSFDDLIPVMKKMMEVTPKSTKDGTKTWGTILNQGSDATYWGNMQMWYKFQGYEPVNLPYLIETDMVNSKYGDILELNRDSVYYKGLKWYNQAYREGVMDPDSINNERTVQKAKVETSLAAMIPSGTCAGWGGYRPVYIEGQKLYQENWVSPYGADMYVVVSAKTKNVDAALRMVDFLADYEAYFEIWCGPQGILWEYGDDGKVYPTQYGLDTSTGINTDPVEFNGEKRVQFLDNFIAYNFDDCKNYLGPNGARDPRGLGLWDEVVAINNDTEENKQWMEFSGYKNFTEQLKAHNAFTLVSDLDYVTSFCPQPDDNMQLTVDAIRDIVVEASWKMVYSTSDEEFEGLWDQMIKDCKDLGGEDIVKWRLAELDKARTIRDSLSAK